MLSFKDATVLEHIELKEGREEELLFGTQPEGPLLEEFKRKEKMHIRQIKGEESRKHVPCDEVYKSKHGGKTYGMWQRFAWGDLSMKANMTLVRYDADDNIGPGSY
jgi:hypothetical protein